MKQMAWMLLVFGLTLSAGRAEQALELSAEDPTALIMKIELGDWYTGSFHHLSGSANSVVFRTAIPFTIGGQPNILTVTMPAITDSPNSAEGLTDMTLFDLAIFDLGWGRLGAGGVALLPTGGEVRGAEKWALGPAIGFTASGPRLLWGLFNQNVFSFAGNDERADVNESVLQPLLNLKLEKGWLLGVSEMTLTYDWDLEHWRSLPLGLKVAKLIRLGGVPLQIGAQYEYNFADSEPNSPEQILRLTFRFLFPASVAKDTLP